MKTKLEVEVERPKCNCHNACDCREDYFSKAVRTQSRIVAVLACSDSNLRSEFPDITDGEIVMIRKVLTSIVGSTVRRKL